MTDRCKDTPASRQADSGPPAPPADRSPLRDRIADGRGEPAELRGLPREVRDLVHAVDRMRSDWAESADERRAELWRALHEASDAVWNRPLPEPADRAEWDALCRETGRLRRASAEMVERADRIQGEVQRLAADRAAVLDEAIRRVSDPAERDGLGWESARDVLHRMAAEAREASMPPVTLPYAHTDDDTDQLHIGVTMVSTLDAESATVYVSVEQRSTEVATAYIRPELVEGVVAALRAARTEADRLAAGAREAGPGPSRVAQLTELLTGKPGREEARSIPCSAAVTRRPHDAHSWVPQPGMTPVTCPGTAEDPS